MMSDENVTTKDSNLADSAEIVEDDTEKSDENVMEEAKSEENNAAENNNLADDNSGNNLQQEYNEPEPKPNPEPEVVEDHVVYKPDGSIDLNESYWANRKDALKAIKESSELSSFKKYISKKYNWTNGSVTQIGWGGQNDKWNVYSFSYHIEEKGNYSNFIRFEFNGKEFVEKQRLGYGEFHKSHENGKEYIYEKLCAIQFIKIPCEIQSYDMYPDNTVSGKDNASDTNTVAGFIRQRIDIQSIMTLCKVVS